MAVIELPTPDDIVFCMRLGWRLQSSTNPALCAWGRQLVARMLVLAAMELVYD